MNSPVAFASAVEVDRCFTWAALDSSAIQHLLPAPAAIHPPTHPAMSLESLILRPLLVLIHTTDILTSLITSLRSSPSPSSASASDVITHVPRHVAFAFFTRGKTSEDDKQKLGDLVDEVGRWAVGVGVEEVSLWSEDGASFSVLREGVLC